MPVTRLLIAGLATGASQIVVLAALLVVPSVRSPLAITAAPPTKITSPTRIAIFVA
jgi:hypothetical protein